MGAEWTTADYALIVSLCSAAISLISLGWNVWSKFIFPKPKVKVWADLVMYHAGSQHVASVISTTKIAGDFPISEMTLPAICLTVTNFGPGQITVTNAILDLPFRHPRRKEGICNIIADEDYPNDFKGYRINSGGLPKKMEVGDSLQLYFPANSEFMDHSIASDIGVRDSLYRMHWIGRKYLRILHKRCESLKKAKLI